MRLAVIADIHGNLEAFKQVLKDIDRSEVDTIINLGDAVGYGPDPEAVVSLIGKRDIAGILGNHELAVIDKTLREQFTPIAYKDLKHTMKFLSPDTVQYFNNLERCLIVNECLYVHGCPPKSVTTYLHWLNESELEAILKTLPLGLSFVGHTHRLECVMYNGKKITRMQLEEGFQPIEDNVKYIINVGSVGQPRDGNNKAKYVIWDDNQKTIEIRFVAYDVSVTMEKIMESGFGKKNALRLLLAR